MEPEEREAEVVKIAHRMAAQNFLPDQLWESFMTEAWREYLKVDAPFERPKPWTGTPDQNNETNTQEG